MLHAADERSAKDNLGVSLTTTPNTLAAGAETTSRKLKPLEPLPETYGVTYERKSNGSTVVTIARTVEELAKWVTDAVVWVEEHLLADVLGLFKKAIKTVFKFAIKVVGKAVAFVFHVAGKVLGFAIRSAEKLLAG